MQPPRFRQQRHALGRAWLRGASVVAVASTKYPQRDPSTHRLFHEAHWSGSRLAREQNCIERDEAECHKHKRYRPRCTIAPGHDRGRNHNCQAASDGGAELKSQRDAAVVQVPKSSGMKLV